MSREESGVLGIGCVENRTQSVNRVSGEMGELN